MAQGDGVHKRVGHVDRLNGEGADGELLLGGDFDQGGFVEQVMLVEGALDVGQGELGSVDGTLSSFRIQGKPPMWS